MASQEDFFASLAPRSIEPTALPEIPAAGIDGPPRERFIEVLEGVGGRLGKGSSLEELQQRVDELTAKNLQVLSMVEGIFGNRDPSAVHAPHNLKDIAVAVPQHYAKDG